MLSRFLIYNKPKTSNTTIYTPPARRVHTQEELDFYLETSKLKFYEIAISTYATGNIHIHHCYIVLNIEQDYTKISGWTAHGEPKAYFLRPLKQPGGWGYWDSDTTWRMLTESEYIRLRPQIDECLAKLQTSL